MYSFFTETSQHPQCLCPREIKLHENPGTDGRKMTKGIKCVSEFFFSSV